jgi:hypothetical protein
MTQPQFLTTPEGGELVVLSRAAYDELIAAARELEEDEADAAAFDAAMADPVGSQPLAPEVSAALMKGDSLLRALRKWRGQTQVQLAQAADIGQGFLSELEGANRTKKASPQTALDVDTGLLSHLLHDRA